MCLSRTRQWAMRGSTLPSRGWWGWPYEPCPTPLTLRSTGEDPGLVESSTGASPACFHSRRPRCGWRLTWLVDLEGREGINHQLYQATGGSVVDQDRGCNSKRTIIVEGPRRLGLYSVFDRAEWELDYALVTGRRTGIGQVSSPSRAQYLRMGWTGL